MPIIEQITSLPLFIWQVVGCDTGIAEAGWSVVRVWEHDLKDEKKVVAKVRRVWETPHGR
jgi:hypothetical protein